MRTSIAPYHYYLVQMFSGVANGAVLPIADATNSINMSTTASKIALVKNQLALVGANPVGFVTVVDFVGFGNANAFEDTAAAARAQWQQRGCHLAQEMGATPRTTTTPTISPRSHRQHRATPLPRPIRRVFRLSPPRSVRHHTPRTTSSNSPSQAQRGTNYIVQGSTNLATTNWLALFTNAAPFTFIQTNAGGFPQRFYRAVSLP